MADMANKGEWDKALESTLKSRKEWEAAITALGQRVDGSSEEAAKAVLDELHGSVRPPHEISKALGDSVAADARRVGFGIYEVSFGPTEVYTRVSELGKKSPGSKPAAHWFLPGWKRDVPTIGHLLAERWGRAMER